MRGIFITFEGPEGAGKTTQLKMLIPWLEAKGRTCLTTREPGGTPLAERIREVVKHHNTDEPVYNQTELLLFAASRAQHIHYRIKPALQQGSVVLCDRFTDSTLAYQGYGRNGDIEFIDALNKYAIDGCEPDLTILLDLEPSRGRERTFSRAETKGIHDRLEAENLAFHEKVRQGYLTLAKLHPKRIKIVSADQSPEAIHQKIINILEQSHVIQ